jgi:hypothetical protein
VRLDREYAAPYNVVTDEFHERGIAELRDNRVVGSARLVFREQRCGRLGCSALEREAFHDCAGGNGHDKLGFETAVGRVLEVDIHHRRGGLLENRRAYGDAGNAGGRAAVKSERARLRNDYVCGKRPGRNVRRALRERVGGKECE